MLYKKSNMLDFNCQPKAKLSELILQFEFSALASSYSKCFSKNGANPGSIRSFQAQILQKKLLASAGFKLGSSE